MKVVRKIPVVLLGIMMLCMMYAAPVEAASEFDYYTWNGDLYISDYYGSGELVIPSTIEGQPVYGIMSGAFEGRTDIERVVLPDCLQYIGSSAFKDCTNLKEVNLPLELKYLWDSAFEGCTSLENLTVSSKVIQNLSGARNYFNNAGKNSEHGLNVIIEDTVTQIPVAMFESTDMVYVTKVTVGENVEIIGGSAFYGCKNLECIEIPADGKLEKICDEAFLNCSKLKEIVLPKSLKEIGADAFKGTKSLRFIDVYAEALETSESEFDDSAFAKVGKSVASGVVVKFEDTVKKIPDRMFYYFEGDINISQVYVGKNVTSIGNAAFCDCQNLTKLQFAENAKIKTIGEQAFWGTGLASLEFPDKLETIEYAAFAKCENLKYVELPQKLQLLGNLSFGNCSSLEYVRVFSENVQREEFTSWGIFSGSGGNAENGLTVVFEDTVKNIPESFLDWGYHDEDKCHVKHIAIGENVESVGKRAFAGCPQLDTVIIEDGATDLSIGSLAFGGCTSLKSVVLPERVSSISKSAFQACSALESLYFRNADCAFGEVNDYGESDEIGAAGKTVIYGYADSTALEYVNSYNASNKAEESDYTFAVYEGCADTHKDSRTITLVGENCLYDSVTAHYCEYCGAVEYTKVAAAGHNYGSWKTDKAATCSVKGREKQTCSVCGDVAFREVECSSHTKGSWVTQKTATDSRNGKRLVRCKVCGDVISSRTVYKVSNIKLSATSYTYDGEAKKPTVTVKDSKGNVIDSKYYTVSYAKGRKNVGTYNVTIKLKGFYLGSVVKTFQIKPVTTKISKISATAQGFKVTWSKKTTQVTGYQIQYSTNSSFDDAVKVSVKKNGTTSQAITGLKVGIKYYVRIRTYHTVDGKNYFSSWSSAKTVTPVPKGTSVTSVNPGSKKLTVKWEKVSSITGYQIQYSTSSSYENAETVSVKGTSTVSKTIGKLKKGKKYYVRVRTYKTVNGKNYYSSWSAKKYTTVK